MNLQKVECETWTGLFWLRIVTGVGSCECGNETLGPIKCGKFLDQLRICQLIKKDCAPRRWLVRRLVSQSAGEHSSEMYVGLLLARVTSRKGRVLVEKLICPQREKENTALYETIMFIIVFIKARQCIPHSEPDEPSVRHVAMCSSDYDAQSSASLTDEDIERQHSRPVFLSVLRLS